MKLYLKIITKQQLVTALPLFALAAVVAILDQWSKTVISGSFDIGESVGLIDGFLKFTYVLNKGAAFSFGNQFPDVLRLILFKVIPVGIGLYLMFHIPRSVESKLMKLAYALILGGGAGNVIDRIRLDYVVDFISVYHNGFNLFGVVFEPWYFAIFNVADSAVSLAAILLVIDFLLQSRAERLKRKENVSKV